MLLISHSCIRSFLVQLSLWLLTTTALAVTVGNQAAHSLHNPVGSLTVQAFPQAQLSLCRASPSFGYPYQTPLYQSRLVMQARNAHLWLHAPHLVGKSPILCRHGNPLTEWSHSLTKKSLSSGGLPMQAHASCLTTSGCPGQTSLLERPQQNTETYLHTIKAHYKTLQHLLQEKHIIT